MSVMSGVNSVFHKQQGTKHEQKNKKKIKMIQKKPPKKKEAEVYRTLEVRNSEHDKTLARVANFFKKAFIGNCEDAWEKAHFPM